MSTALPSSDRAAVESCLRAAVECLRADNLDSDQLPEGALKKLLSPEGFRDLLGGERLELPRDLPSLLQDPAFQRLLSEAMPRMMGAAEITLSNVTLRGRSEGREMDAATRLGVAAHIAQETLAREIARLLPAYVQRLCGERSRQEGRDAPATQTNLRHTCRHLSSPSTYAPRSYSAWEGIEVSADTAVLGTASYCRC